ncbi:energy transducer TonB [Winogradskyella sp. PC D3.3]
MKPHDSISIPKPCREDWSKMTRNKQGRFCQSCSKSVIDFTQMPQEEIQNYLAVNTGTNICGRIKASQLEQIRIEIPQHIIQQQRSFHKLFLLALLIAMGTSLFNCSDGNGNIKKIDAVKITNTLDSIENKTFHTDSILTDEVTEIPEIVGEIILPSQDEIVIGFLITDTPPEFKNTPDNLSPSEKKNYLSRKVTDIIKKNFNIEIAKKLGIIGKHRIFTQFKINENGFITDVKVQSSTHSSLEKEALRVINLLPQFTPGKQNGVNIATIHTLPIVFVIED